MSDDKKSSKAAKDETKSEETAIREVKFGGAVDLVPKWYQNDLATGKACRFIPIRRSEEVGERFGNKGETYVWGCELLEDFPLSRDRVPVDGKAGEPFLMFEPSQPGIQALMANAAKHGLAVELVCNGKVKRMIRSQGRKCDVWDWTAALSMHRIKPSISTSALLLPQPGTSAPVAGAPIHDDDAPF